MKNRLVTGVISFFLCFSLSGQAGFNKSFVFNNLESGFYNLLFDGQDIIAYGAQYHDTIPGLLGIVIAKIDTNGNLLQRSTLFDPGILIAETNFSILKLTSGRIVVVGSVFLENAGFLAIFNQDGSLHLFKKYYSVNTLQYYQRSIIEVNAGFLIGGYRQKNNPNLDLDIFIMQVDSLGNKIWEKNYVNPASNDVMSAIVRIDANTYVVGAGHSNLQNTALVNTWTKSEIFAIDSSGEVKWNWQSAQNIEAGVTGLHHTADGGWIYGTAVYTVVANQNDWGMRCKIVRRDKNLNELWSKLVSPTSLRGNALTDLKPTPDGCWIAAGHWITPFSPGEPNFQGGCLYKISDSGDSIWSRLDTLAWSELMGSRNTLGGVVALPGGSIVAAGVAQKFIPEPAKDCAWLIKTNACGGMDTSACNLVNSVDHTAAEMVRIAPNPATTTLVLEYPYDAKITMVNSAGQIIGNQPVTGGKTTMDVRLLPAGLYFLIVTDKWRRYFKKIVVE